MNAPVSLSPELRGERCTHYRFRYSACGRCTDACPAGALQTGEEGVALDLARCTGCALCAAACPAAVFSARNLPLAALAMPEGDALSIACAPSEQAADVRVPCLGALDAALLASLAARGVAVTLRGAGHCARCATAPAGGERLEGLLDALAAVAAEGSSRQWRPPTVDDAAADDGLDHRRAGRRQLFRRWLGRGAEAIRSDGVATAIPTSAIRVAAHFVPARRRLAEQLLARLGGLRADPMAGLAWGVGYLEATTNDCNGCEACARACPTGALKTADEGEQWRLLATAAQCVGCGVCVEVCTAAAITLHHGWRESPDPVTMIHGLRRLRCQACGRYSVGTADDGCPVCGDDADSFNAIFG